MMKMTRRVTFSAGHRYWINSLSEPENRERFGEWAHPFNHGHNYVLEVTVGGSVDPETGMVINIKRIDDVLKAEIVRPFDQRSLNDEVEHFQTRSTSLENVIGYIAQVLGKKLPPEATLTHLKLEEMPTLWAELDLETRRMTLTRTYEFAASHRLNAPALSHERNLELYGKCNNPAGHGHNYVLEVTVEGSPDPQTGFLCDLAALDSAVNEAVVDRYDHRNLDVDIPEFQGRITTSEIVAREIFDRLVGVVPAKLARVRLFETARNVFEVSASSTPVEK
jgi:6-pyruvoyltetrahydropterin/6-carboxytetrahydropterin synthase